MANYEDDDIDDIEENEPPAGGPGDNKAANGGNRNFLVALGILGAIFIVAIIVLAILIYARRPNNVASGILATNQAILQANTMTVSAATQNAGLLLTPLGNTTPIPGAATETLVVAQATGFGTPQGGQVFTLTPNMQTRTATIGALLTQTVQITPATPSASTATPSSRTATAAAGVATATRTATVRAATATRTATQLPTTGFADEVGLPGLFALAVGLLLVIVLVRRLRFSTNG